MQQPTGQTYLQRERQTAEHVLSTPFRWLRERVDAWDRASLERTVAACNRGDQTGLHCDAAREQLGELAPNSPVLQQPRQPQTQTRRHP